MAVTVTTLTGQITFEKTHPGVSCKGRACVIHNPLKPTEQRTLIWRGDRGFFEDVCVHGVGHPSAEDIEFWNERRGSDARAHAVHGCDGCCNGENWP